MPLYNVEPYLLACLESVAAQTLREIEIICVDDGSTDASLAVARDFAKRDSRVKVLRQKNLGAGVARNKGLAIAKGEYLSLLDSDDIIEPQMLVTMYTRCLEKDADIAICRIDQYDDKAKKFIPTDLGFKRHYFCAADPFSYRDMPAYIFNAFHNCAWNKLIRRSLVVKNKLLFQDTKRTNDLLFTCSALVCAKRITLVDSVLLHYRVNTGVSLQSTNEKTPLDFLYAFSSLKEYLVKKKLFDFLRQSFVNHALSGCMYNLSSIKNYGAFAELYAALKESYFDKFDIGKDDRSYYYSPALYDEYCAIMNNSDPALLWKKTRFSRDVIGRIKHLIKKLPFFVFVFSIIRKKRFIA